MGIMFSADWIGAKSSLQVSFFIWLGVSVKLSSPFQYHESVSHTIACPTNVLM